VVPVANIISIRIRKTTAGNNIKSKITTGISDMHDFGEVNMYEKK
jgi:hypothetical protein